MRRARRDGIEPNGHRQIEEARARTVDDLWLALPLKTVREVAAEAGVSRDTAWRRRKKLEAAGFLTVMSKRERGHARTHERFADVINDPNSILNTRQRRGPRGWRNLIQFQLGDPVTGHVIWESPKFPNLVPASGVPDAGFVERVERALLPYADDMFKHCFPARDEQPVRRPRLASPPLES